MRHGYTFLNVSWTLLGGLTIKSTKIKCTVTEKEEAPENGEVELWAPALAQESVLGGQEVEGSWKIRTIITITLQSC